MQTRVSILSVRRSALAKCFAACLVALVVSPVTAPFPTLGLAEVYGEISLHDGFGATKLVQEAIDLDGIGATLPPLTARLPCMVTGPSGQPDGRSFRPLVLRI